MRTQLEFFSSVSKSRQVKLYSVLLSNSGWQSKFLNRPAKALKAHLFK